MPQDTEIQPPLWAMPPDLATIVAEDGEWEDPSWDPLLLTVVGNTRFEGRLIPLAWQLSLWPADVFCKNLNAAMRAKGELPDGHAWSGVIQAELETAAPDLAAKLHDDSDASTCVLWVETEADGKALIEAAWQFLNRLKAAHDTV
jgi:hypothetical protein